ncbi:cyclase family protein [Streptomyces violaceusniger]|uniref:cyclase family protein n=1 Tax=Streptomyces violaceusniger TaxID=68280 RepID=UPI003420A6A6
MTEDELISLFTRCSNEGRWGESDELGTLNYITDAKRLQAATQVRHGRTVSLGRDLSTAADAVNTDPVRHRMLFDAIAPLSALDSFEMSIHGFAVTHIDALSHVFWNGRSYNGRSTQDVVTPNGLNFGSVYALREGIVTRGVLLDVAAARGVPFLRAGETVTAADLDAAEQLAGLTVESGDAVFVHVGLERREAEEGPEDLSLRAGLGADCVPWLHDHEVAVYSGDCVERIPFPSEAVPLPLHQIGLVSMGLVLLDCPTLVGLVAICDELNTHQFLLTAAPLRLPGGTGSPVNPICVF